jgi:hypothetical protein
MTPSQTTQTLTRLQPTQAPWLHVQALPEGYLLATGSHYTDIASTHINPRRYERITVYLPDGYGISDHAAPNLDDDEIEERFFAEHCRNCDYYFEDQSGSCDGLTDNNDNPIRSCTVASKCPCYEDGVRSVDFPCEEGYSDPFQSDSPGVFRLPPMAFAVDLFARDLQCRAISAWVQSIQRHDDQWLSGPHLRAINTFDSDLVCWGDDNTRPVSLPEAVTTYIDAPSNDDLLPLSSFIANANRARHDQHVCLITALQVQKGYDALLLASAAATPEAYLLLRGSGLPAADGLIICGLTRASHTLEDGTTVPAYLTDPVIDGRSWLLIDNPAALDEGGERWDSTALLLGQIQSTSTPAPCDSPAPSSSEPAAPAAT